ncbi:MAG: hypothetical protein ACLUKN_06085 [Bacilli bacterium]
MNKTFQEGAPLDHPLLNRSIETAQKTVENQNYSIRKRLLQYDDVLNKQREIIYGIRNSVLNEESSRNTVFDLINDVDERIASLALNRKPRATPSSNTVQLGDKQIPHRDSSEQLRQDSRKRCARRYSPRYRQFIRLGKT